MAEALPHDQSQRQATPKLPFKDFLAISNKNTWLNRADSIFKLHSADCLLEINQYFMQLN